MKIKQRQLRNFEPNDQYEINLGRTKIFDLEDEMLIIKIHTQVVQGGVFL